MHELEANDKQTASITNKRIEYADNKQFYLVLC